MTSSSYQRVKEVLAMVRSLAPADRPALLDRECGDNEALRSEVLSLLEIGEQQPDFLESPADEAAGMLGKLAPHDEIAEPLGMPERVGRYRILRRIGTGGMGAVFEAEQDSPRRRVALKMVRPGAATSDTLKRFRREAELLGRMRHPGIAQIYDAGMVDLGSGDQPYFAMEMVRGRPLTTYARDEGLSTRARLELFVTVCDAVQHAHSKGVLHRDLKPDNILVTDESVGSGTQMGTAGRSVFGQPKVLDFGVGRATDSDSQACTLHTTTGQLVGTLPYMSPEQVAGSGKAIDARSDVYALGVVLYELLARRMPYELSGRSIPEVARIIREDEPLSLSTTDTTYRGNLDTIVSKALEKDPDRRYASAAELGADVLRHLNHEPITARPASTIYQLKMFARRNSALVTGTAVAFLALLLGLVFSVKFALSESGQRVITEQREADARFANYQSSLSLSLATKDPLEARYALDQAPTEFRGWEFAHLAARSDPVVMEFVVPGVASGALANLPVPGAVAWPDGGAPLYAFGDDRGLHLVELERAVSTTLVRELEGIDAVSLALDGSHVAALSTEAAGAVSGASAKQVLTVWRLTGDDVPLAEQLLRRPLTDQHTQLLSSRDGGRVAVLDAQGLVRVFDVGTGAVLMATTLTFRGRTPGGAQMAFMPGDTGLVIGCARGSVHLLTQWGVERIVDTDGQFCLAVNRSGDRLALPANRGLTIRTPTPGGLSLSLGARFTVPAALSFSPTGSHLACSSARSIDIWDIGAGEIVHTLSIPEAGVPRGPSLILGDDAASLLTRTNHGARVVNLSDGAARVLRGHTEYVYEAVFSPDGGLIASGGGGREVLVWDVASGANLAVLPCEIATISGLTFSQDGRWLRATAGPDAYVWDTAIGAASLQIHRGDPSAFDLEWAFDAHPEYWAEAAGGARFSTYRAAVQATVTSPDGALQVEGTRSGFKARHVADGRIVTSAPPLDTDITSGEAAVAVGASSGGEFVATGHHDGSINLWDGNTGAWLAQLIGHTGRIYSLDFNLDGSRLASGSRDRSVRLWDVLRRESVLVLHGHDDYVHSVRFSPDGTQLLTSSGDATVRLWDAMPPQQRFRMRLTESGVREAARLRVRQLLDQLGAPTAVAAHLRADLALTPSERSAALRMLLEACSAG